MPCERLSLRSIEGRLVDSGWAALLGAFAGAAASLGGIIITDWLQAHRKAKADKPTRTLLKDMLKSGQNWRRLSTLANVTGLTESEVKKHLVEIGARGSETNPALWGLVSRNPLPEHDPNSN